jgi:hypothetical protein
MLVLFTYFLDVGSLHIAIDMDSSFEDFVFTDDEIREQLEALGFKNINERKFQIFKEGMYSREHMPLEFDARISI